MRKMNKEKFLKTEFGGSFEECVIAWDKALNNCKKYAWNTEEYKREEKATTWCRAQLEVYLMAMKQFYGAECAIARTKKYIGVTTRDEGWLFKIERNI